MKPKLLTVVIRENENHRTGLVSDMGQKSPIQSISIQQGSKGHDRDATLRSKFNDHEIHIHTKASRGNDSSPQHSLA